MTVIGEAEIDISANTSRFASGVTAGMGGAMSSVARLGGAITGAFAFGRIVQGIGTIGIAYQDTLNTFSAVADKAQLRAAGGLAAVGKEATALGNDLSLPNTSAADAARAMTELAKAGLSVKDALAAGKGTLQLAAAATIDEGTAATITANALNTFHLAGTKAADVANVLANAANVSSGEVTDFAQGLAQGGLQAHNMGLSLQETVGALALFANNGLRGSDAGTSLKTMLQRLIPQTKRASDEMKTLGLKFSDAHGNIVPLDNVAEQLHTKLGKLTQAQRQSALYTIFGSDAIRAATLLYDSGGKGVDQYTTSVSKAGGAASVAAAKSKGLGGALRGLQSQAETLSLNIFNAVAPDIEKAVRAISAAEPRFATAAGNIASGIAGVLRPAVGNIATTVLHGLAPVASFLGTLLAHVADFSKGIAGVKPPVIGNVRPKGAPRNLSIGDIAPTAGPSPAEAMGTSIRDAIQHGLDGINVGTIASKIGSALGVALKNLGSIAVSLTAGLGSAIAGVDWVGLGIKFGSYAPQLLVGLATGLINGLGSPAFFSAIFAHLPEILLAAISVALLPAKIAGPIAELLARIPFAGKLLEFMFNGLRGIGGKLLDAVKGLLATMGRGFLEGMARVFPTIGRVMATDLAQFPVQVLYAAGRVASAAARLVGRLGEVLLGGVGKVGEIAGRVVGAILRPFVTIVTKLGGYVGEAMARVVTAVGSRIGSIAATAGRAVAGLAKPFIGLAGKAASWGVDMIRGFIRGIAGMAGDIITAIKNTITDHLPWFVKKALGIKSPSTVFMEIGGQTMDGFILGLTSRDIRGAITRAMQTAVGTAEVVRDAAVRDLTRTDARLSAAQRSYAHAADVYLPLAQSAARAQAAVDAVQRKIDAAVHSKHPNEDYIKGLRREKDALEDSARAAQKAADAHKSSYDKAKQSVADLTTQVKESSKAVAEAQASLADAVRQSQVDMASSVLSVLSDEVDTLVGKAQTLTSTFHDAVMQGADLSTVLSNIASAASGGTPLTGAAADPVAAYIATLTTNLATSTALATDLGTLVGMGLNDSTVVEIENLGPAAGDAFAQSLLAAGPDAINSINTLIASIGDVATNGMNDVAAQLYGPGANVLSSLIDGIKSQFPELDDTIATINAKLATIGAGNAALGAGTAGKGNVTIAPTTTITIAGSPDASTMAALDAWAQQHNAQIVYAAQQGIHP